MRVALGNNDINSIALLPGKIGRAYAKEVLGLPEQRSVQIANFLGDALDFVQQALAEQQRHLDVLVATGASGQTCQSAGWRMGYALQQERHGHERCRPDGGRTRI